MKLPRWLLTTLLTLSAGAVLGPGAWWWVTWPERTAREFCNALDLDDDPAVQQMIVLAQEPPLPPGGVFIESIGKPIPYRGMSPSVWDFVGARRTYRIANQFDFETSMSRVRMTRATLHGVRSSQELARSTAGNMPP
jgi:hypothetical protein